MPTNKKIVQVVIDMENYAKLLKICELEDRSASNKSGLIIKEYIANYEKNHGNINVGNITQNGNNNSINIGR